MIKFRYIDLFSGIGGFRIGLDKIGGVSVGYSEIDKRALETYKVNFTDPIDHDLGDITKINNLPGTDLIVGGVPCQSWSVAGKRRGFNDPRGKLWYDAIRTVDIARPRAFVFENVKGLIDPRNRRNLDLIIEHFQRLGYTVNYKLLNSYDFGAPQNRSRIFIVGFREDMHKYAKRFKYPEPTSNRSNIGKLLDGIESKSIKKVSFIPELLHGVNIPRSRNAFQAVDKLNDFFTFCDTRNGHSTIHSWDITKTSEIEKAVCMAILKNRRKKKYGNQDGNPLTSKDIFDLVSSGTDKVLASLVKKNILKQNDSGKYLLVNSKNSSGINGIYRVFLPNSSIFSTLTATGTRDFVATEYIECDDPNEYKTIFLSKIFRAKKFRAISSRESARIQGFPDSFTYHASDFSAQKQFGNAVSPPVVEAIGRAIISTGAFDTIKLSERTEEKRDYSSRQDLDALQLDLFTS